jgi:hypothetical protein
MASGPQNSGVDKTVSETDNDWEIEQEVVIHELGSVES